uniref:Uncharacterized protein n=1 Tax=Brassica campestris TaxID=3711 RepID=A0A3P5ZW88_BRACM|nr:unnamed protein product [Brassica rapa]
MFVSTFYLHFFCKVLFLYCLLLCVCLLFKSPDDIRISKGNNDDLVEVIMIFSKVQIFSPSFALYSTSKSLVIVREDVLGDRGSVSARNPPPARSDHAGFTLPPVVSSVPEYASVDFDQDERQGKAAWEWFLQTDSMVMKVVSRQEIMVWYQSGPYSYGGYCLSSQILVKI